MREHIPEKLRRNENPPTKFQLKSNFVSNDYIIMSNNEKEMLKSFTYILESMIVKVGQ
jgi:hypothetical protein